MFRFPPRGVLSDYTELYTSFLVSGLIHVTPTDARPLQFFLSQAVAITLEETVIALVSRPGLRHATIAHRLLGYLWVYCWFIYSIGPLLDTMAAFAGVAEFGAMKFSLILGIHQGDWFPK